MKNRLIITLFIVTNLSFLSATTAHAKNSPADVIFIGSTPGDSLIKSFFAIPAATKVDFIRWDLTLKNRATNSTTFVLNIIFGEGKAGTNGFIGGGEKRSFEGKYRISQNPSGNLKGTIYQLISEKSPFFTISMVKMNDNLFHLLTPENKFIVGNGGWSYTLNRKEPLLRPSGILFSLANSSIVLKDMAPQVIFEGRTPCLDLAKEYNLPVSPECYKLKWRFTFNRDPKTFLPTTYSVKRINKQASNIEGKWEIIKGVPSNPDAIIYRLHPNEPEKSVSLLVGDENVLFFLSKDNELFTGNDDFSFTLNKKMK